ncbi:hypothetical protein TorRG33x02_196030 [Trema orientale]|uniref:Uncharacterized protein n=1 Tax=Trema orientale TaxID=63057 RepID=A0A2P5EG75_TREOI|nr:hypothetical protein TorRG33x02_196030 [Trema orientale]
MVMFQTKAKDLVILGVLGKGFRVDKYLKVKMEEKSIGVLVKSQNQLLLISAYYLNVECSNTVLKIGNGKYFYGLIVFFNVILFFFFLFLWILYSKE